MQKNFFFWGGGSPPELFTLSVYLFLFLSFSLNLKSCLNDPHERTWFFVRNWKREEKVLVLCLTNRHCLCRLFYCYYLVKLTRKLNWYWSFKDNWNYLKDRAMVSSFLRIKIGFELRTLDSKACTSPPLLPLKKGSDHSHKLVV